MEIVNYVWCGVEAIISRHGLFGAGLSILENALKELVYDHLKALTGQLEQLTMAESYARSFLISCGFACNVLIYVGYNNYDFQSSRLRSIMRAYFIKFFKFSFQLNARYVVHDMLCMKCCLI